MCSHLRLGIVAAVCAFLIASAVPADAQRRNGSGSGQRGGAGAAPRQPQGPGPSAAPRQGPGPSAGAPAPQNAGRGRAYPGGGPGYRPGGPGPGNRPGGPAPGYRPGYGPGYRPFYGYRGYYPYSGYRGYYPWYGYGGYYPSLYFGAGTWGWPYYYGSWPYAASGYSEGSGGSGLKIEFKPKSAEVYVDGRLAGIVDQFDGMFDSLSLEAGEHEITIYQEGYRSIRQRLYLSEGSTLRMKGALEPLAPAEPNEPRPQAAPQQAWTEPQVQMTPQYRAPEPQYPGAQPPYPGAQPQAAPPDREAPVSNPPLTANSRFGQVAIRVQPADADVLINGELWRNTDGAERMLVYLSPGTHRVEIRKEGFDAFVTAVEIRRGEVTPLNVSLARF